MVYNGVMNLVYAHRFSANPPPQICDALPAQAIVHAVLEVLEARELPQKHWDVYLRPASGWSEARQKDRQVEMVMLGEAVVELVRTRVELLVTQPVQDHVGVGLAEDDLETLVLEEGMVAVVEELDEDSWG